jgi:hypothetical protein
VWVAEWLSCGGVEVRDTINVVSNNPTVCPIIRITMKAVDRLMRVCRPGVVGKNG